MVRAQSGLDYAQQLQSFVPLLCDSLPGTSRHLVSLRGQESSKAATADLAVACLGALQEYILFRCTASLVSSSYPHLLCLQRFSSQFQCTVPLRGLKRPSARAADFLLCQGADKSVRPTHSPLKLGVSRLGSRYLPPLGFPDSVPQDIGVRHAVLAPPPRRLRWSSLLAECSTTWQRKHLSRCPLKMGTPKARRLMRLRSARPQTLLRQQCSTLESSSPCVRCGLSHAVPPWTLCISH